MLRDRTPRGSAFASAHRDRSAAGFRRGAGVFLVYLAYVVVPLVQHHTWPTVVVGFVLMAAFVRLYLWDFPAGAIEGDRRRLRVAVVGMPLLAVAYLAVCGGEGIGFAPYLAVVAGIALSTWAAVPAIVALSLAVTYLPEHVHRWDLGGPQYGVGAPTLLVGLLMYSFRFNRRAEQQLEAANAEIARLAAGQERLRIARDLHDLLGHALTTVTVKAELAAKLVDRDPDRAATEMREVAALARQGLADVRSTVAGYREVSLATELATAREVLAAAGIRAELPASTETVPGPLRPLFGWAVREGITNAVRHAKASTVRVVVTADSVEVVDDGVGTDANPSGSGLSGLAERVAAEGGTLQAGPLPDGGFRLRVAM